MPRDAADTRQRLLDAGRRLFAGPGGLNVPLKRVVEAAGQRNTSALHYHFGGRDGLTMAIIDQWNTEIERRRKEMLDDLGRGASLPQLVQAFIEPQAWCLDSADARQFLVVIGQMNDRFPRWDTGPTPPQALRNMLSIERLLPVRGAALRHERLTRMLEMVTLAYASQARQIDGDQPPALSNDRFVANLAAMTIGALSAA
jgi:AcrR family transcriptional regulator